MFKKILHNTKKRFFSIILIKIAKGNVQENITLYKKNDFLALFWLKSQKEMYKKILHNTKKTFFSITLIEMATANVQEDIT